MHVCRKDSGCIGKKNVDKCNLDDLYTPSLYLKSTVELL